MHNYIDKHFPDNLIAIHKFEQDIHACVDNYSDKSHNDRVVYIQTLKYIDQKLDVDNFRISYNLVAKAYPYLLECDLNKFWSTGVDRLRQVRQAIWDELI